MSKRNAVITAVLVLIALAVVPFVYAQTAHHRRGAMMFGRAGRIKAALGLTDDQVSRLKAIRQDLKAQNAPYREQLRTGRSEIAQLLLKDPDNVAGAQALIDQQASVRRAMQVNVLNAISNGLKVLTPDQRAKASDLLQQMLAAHQHRMDENR